MGKLNVENIEYHENGEVSIVRTNMMKDANYVPYCGEAYCMLRMQWDSQISQMKCCCGYVTAFPLSFIKRYKKKHNK